MSEDRVAQWHFADRRAFLSLDLSGCEWGAQFRSPGLGGPGLELAFVTTLLPTSGVLIQLFARHAAFQCVAFRVGH